MENQITIREAITETDVAAFWEQLHTYHKRDIFPNPEDDIENTSLTMSNIVRIFRRFTTDRRIDASTCFFTEPVRT